MRPQLQILCGRVGKVSRFLIPILFLSSFDSSLGAAFGSGHCSCGNRALVSLDLVMCGELNARALVFFRCLSESFIAVLSAYGESALFSRYLDEC